MTKTAGVTALCALEIGVPDLDAAVRFYEDVWGLAPVARDAASCYLRATGPEYHVLALHHRPAPGFVRVRFGAQSRADVDALFARVQDAGGVPVSQPGPLEAPGGGYGFAFRDPEGREFVVACEVQRHTGGDVRDDRPVKLSHVVFNSLDSDAATAFFRKTLGFRLRDRTRKANFIGCNADHHCIAITDRKNSALGHVAFELPDIDTLMRGCGRLKRAGLTLEWGVGRHGTGNNVFAYFLDPCGLAIEYTTEMEQVDDATYVPGTPETISRPGYADSWGLAEPPSQPFLAALGGWPAPS